MQHHEIRQEENLWKYFNFTRQLIEELNQNKDTKDHFKHDLVVALHSLGRSENEESAEKTPKEQRIEAMAKVQGDAVKLIELESSIKKKRKVVELEPSESSDKDTPRNSSSASLKRPATHEEEEDQIFSSFLKMKQVEVQATFKERQDAVNKQREEEAKQEIWDTFHRLDYYAVDDGVNIFTQWLLAQGILDKDDFILVEKEAIEQKAFLLKDIPKKKLAKNLKILSDLNVL